MRDAVIAAAVRTPIGKRGGALSGIHPVDLSAHVLEALVARTSLDPALVEDVIWGCVSQTGEQAVNVGRNAALAAGWPEDVPGVTVDRQCGSSQQAVQFAAAVVISGQYDVVVAGGVESMSRVPMLCTVSQGPGLPFGPRMTGRYADWRFNQGLSAEQIARQWRISRQQADEIALASHQRAAAATAAGAFATEIVPVGGVTTDEGIRPDTSLEALGRLRLAFVAEDDGSAADGAPPGVVTAGNSSQISDGAAALLITTSETASRLGLTPLARIHTVATAGVDPMIMLTGPIPVTRRVLERAGLKLDDIGAFEVNEAFATVIGAWQTDLGVESALVNPLGGAIALGHPLGGSGARIMTTLAHHMRAHGIRYGLQTMCEGGGMANATVLELLAAA
jgi:acetyl-CoA acyltransferase